MKGFGRRNLGDGGGFIWPLNVFPCDISYTDVYMQLTPISDNSTNMAPYPNTIDVWPFILPKIVRVNKINWLFSAIGASTFVRICLYANTLGELYPKERLWYGQEWNLALTGQNPWRSEDLGTPLLLPGQTILWAGYASVGGNGNIVSNSGQTHHIFGKETPAGDAARIMRVSSPYGIPPDPYPAGGLESTSSGVGIQMRT